MSILLDRRFSIFSFNFLFEALKLFVEGRLAVFTNTTETVMYHSIILILNALLESLQATFTAELKYMLQNVMIKGNLFVCTLVL